MNYLELSMLEATSFPPNSRFVSLSIFTQIYVQVKALFVKPKGPVSFQCSYRSNFKQCTNVKISGLNAFQGMIESIIESLRKKTSKVIESN